MSTTFILSCRNDGYGGSVLGVENSTMKSLNITCQSIKSIDPKAEVIVVDWNPPIETKRVFESIHVPGIRVITVTSNLQVLLDNDSVKCTGMFYEYLAKDIGVCFSTRDNLIFTNADDIFISHNYDKVLSDINAGKLVRATRLCIPRSILVEDVNNIVNNAREGKLRFVSRSNAAAGDFIGIKKSLYKSIGGFLKKHGNWDVDGEFVRRYVSNKIEMVQTYRHYHIEHERIQSRQTWHEASLLEDISPSILCSINDLNRYCIEEIT